MITKANKAGRSHSLLGFQIHNHVSLIGTLVLGLVVFLCLRQAGGLPREVAFMGGIFALSVGFWVTEALPLFATALLVVALQILLLANPGGWPGLGFETRASPSYRDILNLAADPVLVLFFGGFVLAQAAVKEGVDRTMSALLLRPFGSRPRQVLLGVMSVTLLFSMWMSNTATTVMMMALVSPMLTAMPPGEPFRKALVLGVPFAANIGGMGTPIASPPNAIAMGFLQKAGHHVAFLDWMLVAVPFVIGLALFTWLLLLRFFAPVTANLRMEHTSEPLTVRGGIVVAVFIVTVVLWMTDRWHGLPSAVVALLPAVVFTTTGIVTREDLGRLEWSVLILIAGGISLGTGIQLTGMDRLALHWLPSANQGNLWLLAILVGATMLLGTFLSNTATANLLLPIGLASTLHSGGAGGLSPVQATLSIAFAASLSMALPISTPPNAIAYATGELSTRDMIRVALWVGALAAVLIIAGGGFIMRLWGLMPAT